MTLQPTAHRVAGALLLLGVLSAPAPARAQTEPSSTAEHAADTVNPLPHDDATLAQGRKHYLRLCQNCHGKDGRALDNFDFEATDLTVPDRYLHGSKDGEIFSSIKDGAGLDMPPFSQQLTDEQIWQVVHFIRSIGPQPPQPAVSSREQP